MASTTERLDLAPDARSVGQARTFVTEVLRGWGLDDCVDTAKLLTSELATNAVRHASTHFAVIVTRTPDGAQVDVLDDLEGTPVAQVLDLQADGGRGLQLVAGLASWWGTTPADELYGYSKGLRFSVTPEPAAAGTDMGCSAAR